jgi:Capsule assembly protein Wzi
MGHPVSRQWAVTLDGVIDSGLEVRVRRGILFFAGVAGLSVCLVKPGIAQTTQPSAPINPQTSLPAPVPATTPPPSVPAPTEGGAVPSMPAPIPEGQDKIQNLPGYAQQPTNPQTVPAPVQAAPPVVTTASPSPQTPYTAMPAYAPGVEKVRYTEGSTYIPLDSWVYPAMVRLYGLGYLDTMYISMRPYTRQSALHILQASEDAILSSDDAQAQDILAALLNYLSDEEITSRVPRGTVYGLDSVYTRMMGITGSILQDSFHLGQTYFNDYGRPHQPGFNNITGFSTLNEHGRFSLYMRSEYQYSPSGPGYSLALANQLALLDETYPVVKPNYPQATIPTGPIAAQNNFRIVEGTLSYFILGHEISGGKSDAWLGPGTGGAMTWSNNAENIYSFRINRVEPLNIKYLSRLLGPVRYDFFYGSLKGHTAPNSPYVHSEMFSFRPTKDFEFGFQRTVIFGGEGHAPVTIHTFLKGFFDTNDTDEAEKFSRDDPGARFSAFNFSWRLPFVRKYLTLYTDSESHDDLTPVSAPRRAAYRPGLYLSQFPKLKRLDMRVEGVSTDCSTLACTDGSHQYVENAVQKQGYTNKGYIFGDWIGREAKGGQAWLTYHLSGNEWVQVSYLNKKTPKDFIAGGTTQNQFRVDVVKRIGPNVEVQGWFQHEGWKAPIYLPGAQSNNTVSVQVTFFPKLRTTTR